MIRLLTFALLVLAAGPGAVAAGAPAPAAAAALGPAADTLTVVTFNLWNDQHDWPRRLPKIVAGLRALHPDVICLQEVLQHATLPNQATTLADSLGYRAHFVSVDAPDAPKRYGNAILTRHPILGAGGRNLDPKNDYRVVAHVRVDVRGRPVDVYDTHLHHTSEGGAIRAEQIRDLLAFVDSTRGDADLVLAGDFNAELGSPEMRPIEDAYLDAYAATHPGPRGPEAVTLNERLGNPPRAIDHIFVPRAGSGRPASVSAPAAAFAPGLRPLDCAILFRDPGPDSVWASDHFGVVARLLRPVRK